MAKISVRERLERQLVLNVEGVTGEAQVATPDGRGNMNANASVVAGLGGERASDDGVGSGGNVQQMTVDFVVEVTIALSDSSSTTTAEEINRWLADVREAVMTDRDVVETASGEALALDVRYMRMIDWERVDNQAEVVMVAVFEVDYRTYDQDPYTGPGISLLEE